LDADGNYDIYLHDGTSLTNLSDNAASNYDPQISGSNVVWTGDADGNNDIYVAYWLGPDAVLNNVDLSGEDLSDIDFSNADMTDANLTGADLSNTDLRSASFTSADLMTSANLDQSQLPAAMSSLPVINRAAVTVANTLTVSGSVQVDTGGILSVTADWFTAAGVNMQGGTVAAALHGLDLDQIGDVSGHGRLFGDVDLGTSGTIAGSGAGFELFGHVSGSGTLSGTTLFGNLNIGSSPGAITLEDMTLSASGTTTFEVAGTDASQFDRLTLVGTVALDGTAQITFDGFTPDPSDTFQLIDLTSGTASNWFSSVVAPAGWTLSSSGLLAIPEPHTLLLASLASIGPTLRRRRWAR